MHLPSLALLSLPCPAWPCSAPKARRVAPAEAAESTGGQQRARLPEPLLDSTARPDPLPRAQTQTPALDADPDPDPAGAKGSVAAPGVRGSEGPGFRAGRAGAARCASQMRLCHLLAPRPHCTRRERGAGPGPRCPEERVAQAGRGPGSSLPTGGGRRGGGVVQACGVGAGGCMAWGGSTLPRGGDAWGGVQSAPAPGGEPRCMLPNFNIAVFLNLIFS